MADPNSLSNPLEAKVDSINLSLNIDFARKVLAGHVDLHTTIVADGMLYNIHHTYFRHSYITIGTTTLKLDTRALNIQKATLVDGNNEQTLEVLLYLF